MPARPAGGHDAGMSRSTGTEDAVLDGLAEELDAIGERISGIGNELHRMRDGTAQPDRHDVAPVLEWATPPPVPPPVPQPVPLPVPLPVQAPMPQPVPEPSLAIPEPPPEAASSPHRPGLLEREGASSRLLAWVGGAVTLLGVLLLLVLAVQRGWLGPLPRVLGGAGLGLALLGIGLRVRRAPGGRTGSITLAATGVAALYLDVVAATVLYGYLPSVGGLLAGVVVACGGLVLAHRWRTEPLAVAVVVGAAVLVPVLTGLEAVELVAFLLVLQVVAAPVQLLHRWSGLKIVSSVPPLVAALVLDAVAAGERLTAPIAVMVSLATAVGMAVAVAGSWGAVRHGAQAGRSSGHGDAAMAVLVAAPLPLLLLAPVLPQQVGAAVVAVLAVTLLSLWFGVAAGRLPLHPAFGKLAGALGVLAVFEATALALAGPVFAATALGEAIALCLAAPRFRSRGMLAAAAGFGLVGVLVALVTAVPPTVLATFPSGPFVVDGRVDPGGLVAGAGIGLLLAGLAFAGPWAAYRLGLLADRDARIGSWTGGGVGVLYGAAATTLAVALLALPGRTGFLAGHVVITVSWTVAALVLLARGLTSLPLRTAGMSLVAAAVAKLVLFDLATLDGVARVVAFLGAGLVLLAAGTRYAKLVARAEDPALTGS